MAASSYRPYRRPIPYYGRILAYCEKQGIAVPPGFHTRSASKFAVVDTTETPYKLCALTWYLPAHVIEFVEKGIIEGRRYAIFDFKHCREIAVVDGKKLKKGESFECKCVDEVSAL